MKTKLEQSKCESLQKLKILVHTFLENWDKSQLNWCKLAQLH